MPQPFISQSAGRETRANQSSGPAHQSATGPGRSSAIALGASSPTTTCRKVTIAKASAIAAPCAAEPLAAPSAASGGASRPREHRLAEEAEPDARERDAELRGGDRVVEPLDRARGRARAAAALGQPERIWLLRTATSANSVATK